VRRLDLIEFGDAVQCLGSDRRGGGMVEVEELAPDMGQQKASSTAPAGRSLLSRLTPV
jgi:hypothetical protein